MEFECILSSRIQVWPGTEDTLRTWPDVLLTGSGSPRRSILHCPQRLQYLSKDFGHCQTGLVTILVQHQILDPLHLILMMLRPRTMLILFLIVVRQRRDQG